LRVISSRPVRKESSRFPLKLSPVRLKDQHVNIGEGVTVEVAFGWRWFLYHCRRRLSACPSGWLRSTLPCPVTPLKCSLGWSGSTSPVSCLWREEYCSGGACQEVNLWGRPPLHNNHYPPGSALENVCSAQPVMEYYVNQPCSYKPSSIAASINLLSKVNKCNSGILFCKVFAVDKCHKSAPRSGHF